MNSEIAKFPIPSVSYDYFGCELSVTNFIAMCGN